LRVDPAVVEIDVEASLSHGPDDSLALCNEKLWVVAIVLWSTYSTEYEG